MATQKDGGLVSRAVREALGTLVSPQVYGQLLTRSLHASGLTEIPEGGRALALWLEQSLSREIETAVGVDAAELVLEQLAPIVAHATALRGPTPPPPTPAKSEDKRNAFGSEPVTGIAPAPRGGRSDLARTAKVKLTREQMDKLHQATSNDVGHTARPEAPDVEETIELRRVLVASASAAAFSELQSYLAGTAEVVQIADLVGLLDILEGDGLNEPILLVDCQRPTVHVTSIAAIGADLPRNTTVVLWGPSEEVWSQLEREPTCRWVRCSSEADRDDVGSLCAMLVRSAR